MGTLFSWFGWTTRANSTNQDGSVVIGWQDIDTGFRQGCAWTNGVQSRIASPTGTRMGEANACTADGTTVFGFGDFGDCGGGDLLARLYEERVSPHNRRQDEDEAARAAGEAAARGASPLTNPKLHLKPSSLVRRRRPDDPPLPPRERNPGRNPAAPEGGVEGDAPGSGGGA